jgi:hypothetical protein
MYDGENLQYYIKLNTNYDVPKYIEGRVSRLPRFTKTSGLCKVKSTSEYPSGTNTFDDYESSTACRDKCLLNPACTGYQWIVDPDVTTNNCAAFTEIAIVEGNGQEGFECYTI